MFNGIFDDIGKGFYGPAFVTVYDTIICQFYGLIIDVQKDVDRGFDCLNKLGYLYVFL